LVSEVHHNLKF